MNLFVSSLPNWTYTRTTRKAGTTQRRRWVSFPFAISYPFFSISPFSRSFIYFFSFFFFFLFLVLMFVRRERAFSLDRSSSILIIDITSAGAACTCVHELLTARTGDRSFSRLCFHQRLARFPTRYIVRQFNTTLSAAASFSSCSRFLRARACTAAHTEEDANWIKT